MLIEDLSNGRYFTVGDKRYLKIDAMNSRSTLFMRDKPEHGYCVDLESARIVEMPLGLPVNERQAADAE